MIGVAVYLITLITNVTLWPWVFFGGVIVGLTCWAWGQIPTFSMSAGRIWSIRGQAVMVGLLLSGSLYALAVRTAAPRNVMRRRAGVVRLPNQATTQWLPFNIALLDEALRQKRPVVVDWTADWCINCRVVEAVVLRNGEVQQGFLANNAVLLAADLSDDNPAADALNRKLGSAAIPVLAIFSPAHSGAAGAQTRCVYARVGPE